MTVEELITELNKFPKDSYIGFYAWDEFDGQNNLLNFNSIEKIKDSNYNMIGLYLE